MDGSRISHGVAFRSNVRIPMRDGIDLAGDLYQPADASGRPVAGGLPTILERTHYDRTREFHKRCGTFFASRGYNWLVVDSRGRGDSDGVFHLYNRHHEGLDGYDTIEWAAAQPWSNGKIGTTGLSQSGATQQAAAVMKPPHLTTQMLLDCGINYWQRMIRNNGSFAEGIFAPYVFRMAITGKEAAADPRIRRALEEYLADIDNWIRKLPLRPGATPLALAPSYEKWYFEIATQGDYTELYQTPMCNFGAYIQDYPDIPVCMAASWYGNRHAWANFEKFRILTSQNKSPVKLVVGHWEHRDDFMEQRYCGNANFGNDSYINLNDFQLRWFDQFLKGMDTGVIDEPRLRIWVMGGGSGRRDADRRIEHGGRWREIPTWPLPDSTDTQYYLRPDGSLDTALPEAETPPLAYVFNPSDPVPTIGGALQNPKYVTGLVQGGGFDQRGQPGFLIAADRSTLASRPDVLVFRTPVLEQDTEVSGDITVELYVRTSAPDTDFTAKLVDEYPPSEDYPSGYAMNLVDDIVRMSYRDGRLSRDLVEPGEVYRIKIGPMSISNLFRKGHRIRLDISSSSFPQFDVNPNTGAPFDQVRGRKIATNEVFVDSKRPSLMVLPIVK